MGYGYMVLVPRSCDVHGVYCGTLVSTLGIGYCARISAVYAGADSTTNATRGCTCVLLTFHVLRMRANYLQTR